MKKFRVFDTVDKDYLVNSEDLFICATGKIFQRTKEGSFAEVTDCIVEWQQCSLSAEAGFTIYEGDVVEISYINDTKLIGIVHQDYAKIIYADGMPPISDEKKICTIYLKGNIHFNPEVLKITSKIGA